MSAGWSPCFVESTQDAEWRGCVQSATRTMRASSLSGGCFHETIRVVAVAVAVLMVCAPAAGPWTLVPLSTKRDELDDLGAILDSIDPSRLIKRLWQYRARSGRRGYPLRSLWRAYVASFVLDLPSTNHLYRKLEDEPEFRLLCGFTTVPHRTTLNRFITRLGHHRDLVEEAMAALTDQLADALPGFGQNVRR